MHGRPLSRARARVCAAGLRLICCLRNTITFSDRVSRHTRDRARQCALETGDGARAPKPSASFADRGAFRPPSRSLVSARLAERSQERTAQQLAPRETASDYYFFILFGKQEGKEGKNQHKTRSLLSTRRLEACVDVTRGSLSLSLVSLLLAPQTQLCEIQSRIFCSLDSLD